MELLGILSADGGVHVSPSLGAYNLKRPSVRMLAVAV